MDGNPLGADGVQWLGDMLNANDSLRRLNISNTNMMQNRSTHGLRSITFSLRKNRSLQYLSLKNNGIAADGILDLAHALASNRGLTEIDLTGNGVSPQWFEANTYLRTSVQARLPTIRTSLDRNKAVLLDPVLARRHRVPPRPMEDTKEGIWNARRKWKAAVTKLSLAIEADALSDRENARIAVEKAYVEESMADEKKLLDEFLATPEGNRVLSSINKVISQYIVGLGKTKDPPEWITSCHLGIAAIKFESMETEDKFKIPLEKAIIILQQLAVPTKVEELSLWLQDQSSSMTSSLKSSESAISSMSRINIKQFIKFLSENHMKLCINNRLERLRLKSENLFKSNSLEDARKIFETTSLSARRREITKRYRNEQGADSMYVCSFCERRFNNSKNLEKHQKRVKDHRKYLLNLQISDSYHDIVLRAKYFLTGTIFPAYYLLNNKLKYLRDLSPQVFDSRGREGRPIGVIEPELTIRVEDVLGDWMQVRHDNVLGWVQFREGSFHVLLPAYREIRGYWDNLKCWSRPVIYKVSDDLPEYVELKVRQSPQVQDGIVCGFLTKGMVVRYNK